MKISSQLNVKENVVKEILKPERDKTSGTPPKWRTETKTPQRRCKRIIFALKSKNVLAANHYTTMLYNLWSLTPGWWERMQEACVCGVQGVKGTSAITHISFFKKHKLQFIKTRDPSSWVPLCESNMEDEKGKDNKSDRKRGKQVLLLISSCFDLVL